MNERTVQLISEGKTKRILADLDPHYCIIENKSDITAHDNPALTKQFDTKAVSATTTTCRVFELLRDAELAVAYDKQLSPTSFRAPLSQMIPLECIARRYPRGSYLRRFPDLDEEEHFHRLRTEFFLKTTQGKLRTFNGDTIGLNLNFFHKFPNATPTNVDDPLILNPREGIWDLRHPKTPTYQPDSRLNECGVGPAMVLGEKTTIDKLEELTRRAFLVLEGAWNQLGFRLIDFKIEFGINKDGTLLIADVIDNDSWRLRTRDNQEVSKQVFRDGHDLALVEEKYALVAQLVQQFRIPKQALVRWRASKDDFLPTIKEIAGVVVNDITCSAHKAPGEALALLEKTLGNYPDGGVILAFVGMSNGLGPVLSARTTWPVIGVPMNIKEHPEDIWSNVRLPRRVPMLTILNPDNAVLAALNILGMKNPAAYAHVQYDVETLDE